MGDWGKAGQRLTEQEKRARLQEAGRVRHLNRSRLDADNRVAYKLWSAGMLKPYRITIVLDTMGLDGPEVDIACGAQEPDVDLWEAGKLYPTWEQVLLLCKLTGVTPRFLLVNDAPLDLMRTTARFHMDCEQEPWVMEFEPQAIAAAGLRQT